MDAINDFFTAFSSFLWGWPMIILLLGTHIFLTIRLRFPQRKIFKAIKLSVKKDKNATGDVSQFRALATALAATIGTGNIIGVATAIALGGPGAGPMYALEKGLGWKWLAVLFALFAALASFGIGSTVQANAISTLVENQYGISPYITGTIVTALGAAVILGGVKSISKVCGMLVPFMALFYVLGCIYILCVNHAYLLPAIHVILDSAFTTKAAGGGFAGSTVMIAARYGIARGLFSNESGLGSAPIVAAAAQTRNPVRQALVSSTGTFWDTVIICALTGLVITSSIIAYPDIDYHNGAALTKAAFSKIPYIGAPILTIGLATFAFSTTLGWSYYGERCVEYLKGKKWMLCFRIVYIATIFLGSVISLGLVWNIADCMNALMAIPNLISLLCLSGIIVHETRKYLWRDQLDKDMDEKEIEELE